MTVVRKTFQELEQAALRSHGMTYRRAKHLPRVELKTKLCRTCYGLERCQPCAACGEGK
jgi:hypothetical protein